MRSLSTIAILAAAAFVLAGCSSPARTDTPSSSSPTANLHPNPYAAPTSTTEIYGSGATFPEPLITSWAIQYSTESKVHASYQGVGSGAGITAITNKDVLFAGSDAPLSVGEKAKAENNTGGAHILQFPETIGAIAVAYNVAGLPEGVKLTGDVLGQIYAGTIKKWNDPALVALNPGVGMPNSDIIIVYRLDSSGTTFVFTDYLVKTSPSFASAVTDKPNKLPDWSHKSSAKQEVPATKGNDGVVAKVASIANSIGYVELAFLGPLKAQCGNCKVAQMRSHDGVYLDPTVDGASAAADAKATNLPAPAGDWSAVSIVDAPGARSYPISSMTYILVFDNVGAYSGKPHTGSSEMAAFKNWMWWCLHDGQAYAPALTYAPLPDALVAISEGALASIH